MTPCRVFATVGVKSSHSGSGSSESLCPREGDQLQVDRSSIRFAAIDATTAIGRRDRAIVATLIYTAARAGAVASLRLKDLIHDGTQYSLRFTGPTAVGTGTAKDAKVELSRLIDTINDRFGTDFTQADELFF